MADEDSFVVDEEDITFTADNPEVQQPRERKILDDDEAKEERLRAELAAVRELNTLIKSVNGTLEGALNKMEVDSFLPQNSLLKRKSSRTKLFVLL